MLDDSVRRWGGQRPVRCRLAASTFREQHLPRANWIGNMGTTCNIQVASAWAVHIGTAQHANYAGKFRKAHCNSRHVGFKKASCSPDLRWSAADLCQRKPCSAGSRCLIDTCFRWRDQFSQHLWTCTSSKERLVSSCRLNPLRATSSTTFQFIGQANEKWKQMKAMVTEWMWHRLESVQAGADANGNCTQRKEQQGVCTVQFITALPPFIMFERDLAEGVLKLQVTERLA